MTVDAKHTSMVNEYVSLVWCEERCGGPKAAYFPSDVGPPEQLETDARQSQLLAASFCPRRPPPERSTRWSPAP